MFSADSVFLKFYKSLWCSNLENLLTTQSSLYHNHESFDFDYSTQSDTKHNTSVIYVFMDIIIMSAWE